MTGNEYQIPDLQDAISHLDRLKNKLEENERIILIEPKDSFPLCPKRVLLHGTSNSNFDEIVSSRQFKSKLGKPYFTSSIAYCLIHAIKHDENDLVITFWTPREKINPSLKQHSYDTSQNLSLDSLSGQLRLPRVEIKQLDNIIKGIAQPPLIISDKDGHHLESFLNNATSEGSLQIEGLDASNLTQSIIRGLFEDILTTQIRSVFITRRKMLNESSNITAQRLSEIILKTLTNLSSVDVSSVVDLEDYKIRGIEALTRLQSEL